MAIVIRMLLFRYSKQCVSFNSLLYELVYIYNLNYLNLQIKQWHLEQ
jgi:hypothetical protein